MSSANEAIEKLADHFNKKEIVTIEVSGNCDEQGFLIQNLNLPVKLNPNVSHKISLVSLECTSFFPNVISSNNKFYYSNGKRGEGIKEITIAEGAYEFSNYNDVIKANIEAKGDDKDSINIAVNLSTAKTEITLKNNYRVYFDRTNTWGEVLGYNSKVLNTNGLHISDNISNIMLVQKVYVCCDICKGSLINRNSFNIGNILFSFPNNKKFGFPISIQPSVLRPRDVIRKEFDTIRLQFKSDLDQPVNFMNSLVTGELLIEQQ